MIKNIAEIKKEYIRIGASRNGLQLEIRCINWEGPHTPVSNWVVVKRFDNVFQMKTDVMKLILQKSLYRRMS